MARVVAAGVPGGSRDAEARRRTMERRRRRRIGRLRWTSMKLDAEPFSTELAPGRFAGNDTARGPWDAGSCHADPVFGLLDPATRLDTVTGP